MVSILIEIQPTIAEWACGFASVWITSTEGASFGFWYRCCSTILLKYKGPRKINLIRNALPF